MKWTSANSTDRKSVFYTSEDSEKIITSAKQNSVTDNVFTFKMGGSAGDEEESQNSKSSNSIESNSNNNRSSNTDLKRYLKNFMLFSNLEIESEKKCRDEQLSKIVKALLYFEKKLRKEQEIIQQQLCEKDKLINQQMQTISNMKVKYGVLCDDNNDDDDDNRSSISSKFINDETNLHETAKYCPMCRKKYYSKATKNVCTQTNDSNNNKLANTFSTNINDDYTSIQNIDYMSSNSEEQETLLSPNPFSTARRSKKYTSKKSYKDYLQSRPHNNNFENNKVKSSINNNGSMLTTTNDFPNTTNSDNNNNIANLNGNEIGVSKSTNCGGTAKFSLIMNDIHGIKQQQKTNDDTHSLKINRMHGISFTTIKNEEEQDIIQNNNIQSLDAASHHYQSTIKPTKKTQCEDDNGRRNAVTRKYYDESMEVKQKIATKDDWYASDIEDSSDIGKSSSYSHTSVTGVSNSVLECVNQILLQQSMDDFIESQNDKKSNGMAMVDILKKDNSNSPSTATTTTASTTITTTTATTQSAPTRSNKRVHFSTKNSMVQITPLPSHRNPTPLLDLHDSDDVLNSTYENQSNEYEPIGSSRSYVDMDIKPKLPPKPENLMKLQQISLKRQFVQDQIYKQKHLDYEFNESEPDYCSISEIQDTIKSVKIVTAEIHNDANSINDNAYYNEYSEIKEVPTPSEFFADVPKLPNVYSIIPGFESPSPTPRRKEPLNKCIGQDNYITKSPIKKKLPIQFHHTTTSNANKRDSIKDSITINNNNNNNNKKLPPSPPKVSPPSIPISKQTIKIIDDKISEITKEFDWYNLDFEYTKTDVVVTTQIENIEEMYQFDDEENLNVDDVTNNKVEYNLDFEYDRASSDGIEIEKNINNNFTTVIKINETSNDITSPVNNTSSKTSTNLIELAETPKLDLKKKLNYEKFLNESGMISKPLPRKNKFYAGSFV